MARQGGTTRWLRQYCRVFKIGSIPCDVYALNLCLLFTILTYFSSFPCLVCTTHWRYQDDSFHDASDPAGMATSSGSVRNDDVITAEVLAQAAQEPFGGAMPASDPCPLKSALWSCTQSFIRTTGTRSRYTQ